jgi:ribosomal protein S18 acetylase RimI-like enzyme
VVSDSELIIKPLNENCNLSSFSCKDSDLNAFLKNDALNYQKYMISKTNLCFFGNELVGYITLTIDTIGTRKVKVNDEFESKYSYPSIKIARLAVDSRFERRGIGTHLLYAAIGKALSISDSVGCRFVLVDSKKDAISFYEKYGFKKAILKEKDKRDNYAPMYFDLQPTLLKINSYVEGKGDSSANIHVQLKTSSSVAGGGSSTANIQVLDYNEKKK